MAEQWRTPDVDELCDAFLALPHARRGGRASCATSARLHELEALAHRLAVRAAARRRHALRRVAAEVGASTTTVTRVAHWLRHGEGGYRIVLDRAGEAAQAVSRPFRLALPSKGRMHEPAAAAGPRVPASRSTPTGRALHTHCPQWDIEVLFARTDDIPVWAAGRRRRGGHRRPQPAGRGAVARRRELLPLGFGRCALTLAVAATSPVQRAADLDGSRVATAYPVATAAFFAGAGRRRADRADPRLGRAGAAAGRRRGDRRPRLERRDAAPERPAPGGRRCSSRRRCCSSGRDLAPAQQARRRRPAAR